MSAEIVSQTIQAILAPAVMISACAIILGGILGRYATINDRLRALNRERLDLIRSSYLQNRDPLTTERLNQIDRQVPSLLHRLKLAHDAVFALYGAIAVFVTTTLVIALAAKINSDVVATIALVMFLGGMGVLFAGLALTLLEVGLAQRAITYEILQVASLKVFSPETTAPESIENIIEKRLDDDRGDTNTK